MYTSALLVALTGLLAPSVLGGPVWQTNYDTARKLGREGGKPLAVFIGSGKAGWNQMITEGQLSNESRRLLSEQYVCLYVDVRSPAGKRLASSFQLEDGPGLVLSDQTGKLQAFRHEGDLADDDLVRSLQRYADPELVVRATEGDGVDRTSYYAPAEQYQPAPVYYPAPAYYYPSFVGGGGRGC
jgi:hypothetical protein